MDTDHLFAVARHPFVKSMFLKLARSLDLIAEQVTKP